MKFYNYLFIACLLYTSDAADERSSVDLGGRRIIKKKTVQVYPFFPIYTKNSLTTSHMCIHAASQILPNQAAQARR